MQKDHYIDYEDAKGKLRRFFDGSEHERFLKSINSFLYEGIESSSEELPTTEYNSDMNFSSPEMDMSPMDETSTTDDEEDPLKFLESM